MVLHESGTTIPGLGPSGSHGGRRHVVGVLNLLGERYKARFPGPLAAYNRLQTALMRHFVHRGGTVERSYLSVKWQAIRPVSKEILVGQNKPASIIPISSLVSGLGCFRPAARPWQKVGF